MLPTFRLTALALIVLSALVAAGCNVRNGGDLVPRVQVNALLLTTTSASTTEPTVYVTVCCSGPVDGIQAYKTNGTTPIWPPLAQIDLLSCGGFAESIAVDSTGKIYTTVGSGVAVEAPPVNGHFRTVAFITGPHTGIVQPEGVAIGPGNVLYVTNSNFSGNVSVTEYRPGANGDAAPIRTIQGPKTLLDNTGSGSIAVDSSGKIYVANSSSITVYAANASGDASPIASIKGSRTLLSSGPGDIALDALNRIYVIILPNQGRNAFLLFSAGANGNVSPLRTTVTDAANGVPIAIALDSVGKVFVVQSGDFTADAIVTYARTTNGSYTERSVFYSQDSPPSLANAGGIAVR